MYLIPEDLYREQVVAALDLTSAVFKTEDAELAAKLTEFFDRNADVFNAIRGVLSVLLAVENAAEAVCHRELYGELSEETISLLGDLRVALELSADQKTTS